VKNVSALNGQTKTPRFSGLPASRCVQSSEVIVMEWKDQYKHPLWQKKRLEALEYYGFECSDCGDSDSQLHVHHVRYKKGAKMWDYNVTELSVLCDKCHSEAHRSKEFVNDFCLFNGAGSERVVAELISGYQSYNDHLSDHVFSHLCAVGYGAGYLSNLSHDEIISLTHISPSDLQKFIKENS